VKSLILILLASTLAVESYAQRALDFANCAPGVNAPITNAAGSRITAPSSFVVDLFYNTNTNAVPNPLGSDSFLAGGFNQGFSSGRPGYFLGGSKSLTATNIIVQVRCWDSSYGSTYAAARDAGGQFGYSGTFVITLTAPPATPVLLSGLTGFQLRTLNGSSPGLANPGDGGVELPPVTVISENPLGPGGLFSAQYGCGPWLEVTPTNNSEVMVTLHNSAIGRPYKLWSKTDLNLTNWTLETNFVGAASQTQLRIAMGSRTNLFLRTGETNASFQGLTGNYGILSSPIPDTMGAVGRDHFVELLNGEAIAVFAKTNGQMLQTTDVWSFFAVTNSPVPSVEDPRILYDRDNQRWIASMINYNNNNNTYDLMLAVSKTASPVDLIANWVKYTIKTTQTGSDSDFDTMGMDTNGIYLSVVHRSNSTNAGFTVIAVRKQDIYAGKTNYTILTNTNPGLLSWAIQPAVNFDPVAPNGYAWFVAKGPPEWGTNYYQGGPILYRRLQWSGSNAVWADPAWVTNLDTAYRSYYDFDGTNGVYAATSGIGAPQGGGTDRIDLGDTGSRLMTAVIRNGYLWTCQHVGLSGTTGVYAGSQTGTNVDRSAVQWVNFQVGTTNLTFNAYERVFDPATTNPFWYYFPSLMVTCNSDMVIGFSGSSANNYIGAYYTWLFSGANASTRPFTIQAGSTYFNNNRWGDYSATSLDPDDWSIWTVQEYAFPSGVYPWATWIIQLNRDP